MDDIKRAYVNMCQKVVAYFVEKATEISATAAADAVTLSGTLDAKITTTQSNDTNANLDNTGEAEAKNTERDELNTSVRTCIPFIVKHFKTTAQTVKMRQVDFLKSELEGMDDNKFYENCKLVNDFSLDATIHAAIIALGYTAPLQTAFNTNLGEFKNLIGRPRMAIGLSSSYNKEIEKNIQELHTICDDIDIEMNLIEMTESILFNAYKAVRKIDDAAGSGGMVFSNSVNAGETKNVRSFTYDAAINLRLENSGAVDLSFQLYVAGAAVGAALNISAGNTENHPIADLHNAGDSLMVINTGITIGSYKVTFS